MNVFGHWLRPEPGARIRQIVATGPFVIQERIDLGMGACRLHRHRTAIHTTFTVVTVVERTEEGLPCFQIVVDDDRDGRRYVVDTGACGPGLPPETFVAVPPEEN